MSKICPLFSGSTGNSTYIEGATGAVLADVGMSCKAVTDALQYVGGEIGKISAVVITHEHIDHIAGIGVMARRHNLPIYATAKTIEAIKNVKSVGKIDDELFHPINAGDEFDIGTLRLKPLHISHDAADPVAYRVDYNGKRMAVITDLGTYDNEIVDELQNLDVLLLEANHDIHMLQTGSYPYPLKQRILGDRGHLSNERSGQLLCELLHDRFKTVMLGHLSKENNYEELAYEAVRLEVTMGDNPYKAEDFPMYVAKRDTVSPAIRVE